MKTYKLSIVPFLNKDRSVINASGIKVYSLYFKITYMRQTTLLRSINEKRYEILNTEDSEILKEKSELEDLIFFLSDCQTQPFNLNGLKDKYLLAQQTLIQAFDTIFRTIVKRNAKKIKDPMIVTLNIGEYSEDYPLHLLLTAVNQFFRKHTEKLFNNCFHYIDMIGIWMEFYPMNGEGQPRLITFLAVANNKDMDVEFHDFLNKKLKSKKKSLEFYTNLVSVVVNYLQGNY